MVMIEIRIMTIERGVLETVAAQIMVEVGQAVGIMEEIRCSLVKLQQVTNLILVEAMITHQEEDKTIEVVGDTTQIEVQIEEANLLDTVVVVTVENRITEAEVEEIIGILEVIQEVAITILLTAPALGKGNLALVMAGAIILIQVKA